MWRKISGKRQEKRKELPGKYDSSGKYGYVQYSAETEVADMLVIAIMIGLVIGSLVLRGRPLPAAAATEGIEPTVKKVRASVDGKPVYSYVQE